MTTRQELVDAFFPLMSMANPTNSAINKILKDTGLIGAQRQDVVPSANGTGAAATLALGDVVTVTSANANHILMLPSVDADDIGETIQGWIGATACEMRADGTAATINGLDCKTTNEVALPATGWFIARVVGAETWLLHYWTELGAASTLVPDAV